MAQQENKSIKSKKKNIAFKYCCNNSSNIDLKCRLKYFQACLNTSIEVAKEKYHHNTINKLINTQKKVYWSLLKIFLNNEKIPIIPLLFYENHFLSEILRKSSTFQYFLS